MRPSSLEGTHHTPLPLSISYLRTSCHIYSPTDTFSPLSIWVSTSSPSHSHSPSFEFPLQSVRLICTENVFIRKSNWTLGNHLSQDGVSGSHFRLLFGNLGKFVWFSLHLGIRYLLYFLGNFFALLYIKQAKNACAGIGMENTVGRWGGTIAFE